MAAFQRCLSTHNPAEEIRRDNNLGSPAVKPERAESVKHWLIVVEKLAGPGFAARGFGATRFAAPNTKQDGSDDPAGRQKNRRVEIVIQRRI
jgi:hypothetical protein